MAASSVVTVAAVVLALALVLSAVGGSDAVTYMSMKNNLAGGVRFFCYSNLQTRPSVDLMPGGSAGFDIDRAGRDKLDVAWSCNFSGPDSCNGAFVLWRRGAGPCLNPSSCPWILDAYGLSLTRYDGYVEHVYRWP